MDNPLLGEKGASYVFGPQKGATPEIVKILDKNLASFANIIESKLGKNIKEVPGAGAAGGLGFGLMTFLNAKLEKGIDLVIEYTKLREKVKKCRFCVYRRGEYRFSNNLWKNSFWSSQSRKRI